MAKIKITKLPETITVEVNDQTKVVRTEDYIKAKTKALREFGYGNLTEDTVRQQVGNILGGMKLDVIGMFMRDEIVKG